MAFLQKIKQYIFNGQKKVHHLLDPDSDFWYSKLANSFIIATIILNILAFTLETEPNIRLEFYILFQNIEYFSLIVFTVEYLLRFWSAPASEEYQGLSASKARWKYTTSFFGIIDLLAIIPFFFSFFIPNTEALRIIRLFRVFKVMRYNAAMNTLLTVVKEKAKDLMSVIFLLTILLILASSGVYLFEHEAQPEHFGSILRAMWWAIVTISTVGYGDAVPITVAGRIFAGGIMVLGIGLVALPAGILASAFSEQLGRHKIQYRNAVQDILAKGQGLNAEDEHILKSMQNKCNLSDQDAKSLYQEVASNLEKQAKQDQAMADVAKYIVAQPQKQNITKEESKATPLQNAEKPIKFCANCGEEIAKTDNYCRYCGKNLKN